MISRVAASCFWLNRYVERVESLARAMEVNLAFVLDVDLPPQARWRPLVIVVGEQRAFHRAHNARAATNAETVQDFLVWDARNPSSLQNSVYWARENARTIRETISLEVWRTINELWLWLNDRAARQLYQKDRPAFYRRVSDQCLLYQGIQQNTMLHEEALDFMSLGTALERAGQTARILDVKYHSLGPTRAEVEMPLETAQWLAILRSCLGVEPFFKRAGDALSGPAVAGFLLLDRAFPRSVLHNLHRARVCLADIRRDVPARIGGESADALDRLLWEVAELDMDTVMKRGLHAVATQIVEDTAAVCTRLHEDYFNPARAAAPQARRAAARQVGRRRAG